MTHAVHPAASLPPMLLTRLEAGPLSATRDAAQVVVWLLPAAPQPAYAPRLRVVLRRRGTRRLIAALVQALQLLDVREPRVQCCAAVRKHRELRPSRGTLDLKRQRGGKHDDLCADDTR